MAIIYSNIETGARDFSPCAMTAIAEAIVGKGTDADAGAEDGAEGNDGHVVRISDDRCNDAGAKAGVGCYTSLCCAITSR